MQRALTVLSAAFAAFAWLFAGATASAQQTINLGLVYPLTARTPNM